MHVKSKDGRNVPIKICYRQVVKNIAAILLRLNRVWPYCSDNVVDKCEQCGYSTTLFNPVLNNIATGWFFTRVPYDTTKFDVSRKGPSSGINSKVSDEVPLLEPPDQTLLYRRGGKWNFYCIWCCYPLHTPVTYWSIEALSCENTMNIPFRQLRQNYTKSTLWGRSALR